MPMYADYFADYAVHDEVQRTLRGIFWAASANTRLAGNVLKMFGLTGAQREFEAVSDIFDRSSHTYEKPSFNLPTTRIGNRDVPVSEHVVLHQPYGDLVHFERDTSRNDPKTLLVTPMSGHYATLLRSTVEGLLPHHDLYITDWANARDVPKAEGDFGLDTYVEYIRGHLQHLGPNTHVVAVCQPTVPVLAATSLMAAAKDPNQPISLTLMGGPLDTRAAPTEVTRFAEGHSLQWFKDNALSKVPCGYAGAGQSVYPGFKQLTGFMMMNPDKHVQSHLDMFNHLRRGDRQSAQKIAEFYDEYLAVQDLAGRFYIETIDQVFKRHLLPKGEMIIGNHKVDPSAIRGTALLTIEGELDDISAPGQTIAAHRMCNNISPKQHFNHLQRGVGHYGIFAGRAWKEEIRRFLTALAHHAGVDNGLKYSPIQGDTRSMPSIFVPH